MDNPGSLPAKEWPWFLLLLIPVVVTNENISLKVTNFNSSEVELSCRCDYNGDMTDVFFDVYKEEYSCLHRTSEWCRENLIHDCDIRCLSSELPKNSHDLPFLVKLNGSCDEVIKVQCTIRNAVAEKILDLEESIQLTAQSDPPVIFVNESELVEANSQPVQIVCVVTNMCHTTELDISIEVPVRHVSTTYKKEENRFHTTAKYEAIFLEAGNYTISCQEAGKDNSFSRSHLLEVHTSEKDLESADMQHRNGHLIGILTLLLISTAVGFGIYIFCRRKKARRYGDVDAEKEGETVRLLQEDEGERYSKIENIIKKLTSSNMHEYTRQILEILGEGRIIYPEDGNSIMYKLVEKSDELYRVSGYAELLQALVPSYRMSVLSEKEDLSEVIWEKVEYHLIENWFDAQKCKYKLTILSLDAILTLRLCWRCALDSLIIQEKKMWDTDFSDVLKCMATKAANSAYMSAITTDFDDPKLGISSYKTILNENINLCGKSKDVLNFIIKSIPSDIFENDSRDLSSFKNLLVKNCVSTVQKNPAACDHVDDQGRTPVHNLMQKLLMSDSWKRKPDFIARADSLWNLMSHLITSKNVNIRDKNSLTPYSWILWWQESAKFIYFPDRQGLTGRISDIVKHCHERGAVREDAYSGVTVLREREMGSLLKRMIKMHMATEFLLTELQVDLERIKDMQSKGLERCITILPVTEDIKAFALNHTEIRNYTIREMSVAILDFVIVDDNAQEIYDTLFKKEKQSEKNEENINNYTLLSVLKLCLDKGANPAVNEIYERCPLLNETTYENLSATVKIMELLIRAYRNQGIKETIKINLNPIQGQWNVGEDLRTAAGKAIRAAYSTLGDCVKSKSAINILLFLRNNDEVNDIKKCFEQANALLKGGTGEVEAGQYNEITVQGKTQVKRMLTERNDNWLRRSVLHLAAIFCHDEQVLENIPKVLIETHIDDKDIHGCTPVYIAQMHGNQSATRMLKSLGAKISADYFGNLPESLKPPCAEHYNKSGVNISDVKLSVFDAMKSMLVLPINEAVSIENDLKELFSRMVAEDGLLNSEIVIGGSMREMLKVGRWDEFHVQLHVKSRPGAQEPCASLTLHEYLLKRITEIDMTGISLRCVSVGFPWTFIWEGEGSCKGQHVSVYFVLVTTEGKEVTRHPRQELIIDNAPQHHRLSHLKWNGFLGEPLWLHTSFQHEWDIMDNLPPGCRLGILISNALLQALDQTPSANLQGPITPHVVKNTLIWILAGETPGQIQCSGNIVGERYGALRQKLLFKAIEPKWFTEEDLKKFEVDGKFWAEKIFDAICFMAREYSITLGNFLECQSIELNSHEVTDVQLTCKRCLEKLRPQVFFSKAGNTPPAEGDIGFRTRLQDIINRLNKESETGNHVCHSPKENEKGGKKADHLV